MSSADEIAAPRSAAGAKRREVARPGLPVDPYRLRRAFLSGWKWLVLVGALGVVLGYVWSNFMMTSGYLTTAVLKYEGDLDVVDAVHTRNPLGPAADALTHESVLRKIASETGFGGSLTAVKRSIGYEIDPLSGTLDVTVGGATGEEAAEYAKTVTDVFLRYHKQRQARRIEVEISRVQKRIDAAKDELAGARREFEAFRQKHGITHLSTEQQSMVQSAAQLRADSEMAAYEIRAVEAQVQSLESQLASTPKTTTVSGGGSPERAVYDQLRQELASARATLSPEHPRVQALEEQVGRLRRQIRSGGASTFGGGVSAVNSTYQVLQEQIREAKSRLATLRERRKGLTEMANKAQLRFENFADIEGEASTLLAEVEVNESLLSDLRRKEASLEDALSDPPSGFVVLDPGPVPEYPEVNKMRVVMFGAISMLGFGLGLLILLYREFWGFRVETPTEVAFWGKGPVLGATSWPDDPLGLDELVAGLDDLTPVARGNVLVIGGDADDSRLVRELAERMNEEQSPVYGIYGGPPAPEGMATAVPQGGPTQHSPPLYTPAPPPSGPYPIGGSAGPSVGTSTALVRRVSPVRGEPDRLERRTGGAMFQLELEAWSGPYEGQVLRRAARLADRVLVLVRSGAMPAMRLNGMQHRLGRTDGIGYIVVGLPDELGGLPDRAGDVAGFWESGVPG